MNGGMTMTSARVRGIKRDNIRAFLAKLGLTEECEALDQLVWVILRAHEDAYLVSSMRNLLYPSVVKLLDGVSQRTLERNMSEMMVYFWQNGNLDRFHKILGYKTICRPSTAEFVETVRKYMEENGLLNVLY